jgi:hypothetical protein
MYDPYSAIGWGVILPVGEELGDGMAQKEKIVKMKAFRKLDDLFWNGRNEIKRINYLRRIMTASIANEFARHTGIEGKNGKGQDRSKITCQERKKTRLIRAFTFHPHLSGKRKKRRCKITIVVQTIDSLLLLITD